MTKIDTIEKDTTIPIPLPDDLAWLAGRDFEDIDADIGIGDLDPGDIPDPGEDLAWPISPIEPPAEDGCDVDVDFEAEEESAQAGSFPVSAEVSPEDSDDLDEQDQPDELGAEIRDQEIAESLTRMSDALIADMVARILGNRVRYNADRGRFAYFSGATGLWSLTERDPIVRQITREICQRAAAMISPEAKGSDGQHKWYGDAKRMSGVEQHLKAMPGMSVSQDDFDADPYLLGTPGGVIDLRTGKTLAHAARHLISRSTSVVPAEDEHCLMFQEFLKESVGSWETVEWLQRWLGYALSGLTVDQTMLFLYGSGANGKSVLAEIMLRIIGHYAKVMDSSSLMASGVGKHPTDIAALAGARFVTANEVEKGAKLAEARVKGLVAGDKITARYMHCDQFDFQSRIKLVMIGNYLPEFSTSYSMRRRIKIVPFLNRPARMIPDLIDRIMAEEAGQILRWLINGCVQAISDGVGTATEVEDYTDEIFRLMDGEEREDPFADFLAMLDRDDPDALLPAGDAYRAYCKVVRDNYGNREPISQTKFGRLMIHTHKIAIERTQDIRYYKGIALPVPPSPNSP